MRTIKQLKNFVASLLQYILTLIFSFFTRKLFIEALGVEYLGVSGLMGNILGMLSIAELGIGSSIVFSLYKPLAENNQNKVHLLIALYRKLYCYIAMFVLIMGLALMPFLSHIAPDISSIPHYNIIYLLFLANSVIPYFFAYNSTLYTANQQDYKLQGIRTLFYILSTSSTILILIFLPNYIVLTACTTLLGIASQLIIYYLARKKWPWLSSSPIGHLTKDDTDTIKKNVGAMVMHKIGDYCVNGTSNIIIANAINLATVGLMANYTTLISVLKSVIGSFFNAMIAGIGNLIATERPDKVHQIFQEMNFLAFWFFGLAMTGIYFCCDQIIYIWLGNGFVLPRLAVLFIAIDVFVLGMRIPPHIIKSGAGMFSNDKFAPLFQSLVNLAVGIYLARIWGVAGVAFAILLSGLCVPSWFRPYVLYRDLFKISFKKYIFIYVTYSIILLILFLILHFIFTLYLPSNAIWELVYRVLIILILYHLIIGICGWILPQGRVCFSRCYSIIKPILSKICPSH